MQFARWSILSKWGNLRNLICRSKNRFCSLEISTSLCCLTSVQTSAFRTKVVMCIAKEIRLTLIAKVFMAQELTQGTYDLLFAVQALNAAVEMWNCERCFLKGYGILSRFRKPENSFFILYYNCEWMSFRQSVDRYVSLLSCVTSVLSELIGLKKIIHTISSENSPSWYIF